MAGLLDRRGFLIASATLAVAGVPRLATAASAVPVCGWCGDQPFHDPTGEARPYRPPPGLRGAADLADLDETGRRFLAPYL